MALKYKSIKELNDLTQSQGESIGRTSELGQQISSNRTKLEQNQLEQKQEMDTYLGDFRAKDNQIQRQTQSALASGQTAGGALYNNQAQSQELGKQLAGTQENYGDYTLQVIQQKKDLANQQKQANAAGKEQAAEQNLAQEKSERLQKAADAINYTGIAVSTILSVIPFLNTAAPGLALGMKAASAGLSGIATAVGTGVQDTGQGMSAGAATGDAVAQGVLTAGLGFLGGGSAGSKATSAAIKEGENAAITGTKMGMYGGLKDVAKTVGKMESKEAMAQAADLGGEMGETLFTEEAEKLAENGSAEFNKLADDSLEGASSKIGSTGEKMSNGEVLKKGARFTKGEAKAISKSGININEAHAKIEQDVIARVKDSIKNKADELMKQGMDPHSQEFKDAMMNVQKEFADEGRKAAINLKNQLAGEAKKGIKESILDKVKNMITGGGKDSLGQRLKLADSNIKRWQALGTTALRGAALGGTNYMAGSMIHKSIQNKEMNKELKNRYSAVFSNIGREDLIKKYFN